MASEDTRELLLNAAEKLFAARGFDDVGLRDIANEVGSPVSSITYHFGSRERLIEEVISRRFIPINNERLELLAKAEEENISGASLLQILDAFIHPPIVGHDESISSMLPILANCFMCMQHIAEDLRNEFRIMLQAFLPKMRRHCPEICDQEFVWRFHLIIGMLIRCLQSLHQGNENNPQVPCADERKAVAQQLVHCAHALLSAPACDNSVPPLVNPLQELTLRIIQESESTHAHE